MKSTISSKLSLAFGVLVFVVLIFAGFLVYFQFERELSLTINNSLETTSELIKKNVNASIKYNSDEVRKDLLIAEYLLGNNVTVSKDKTRLFNIHNIINEQEKLIEIPVMEVDGTPISGENLLVDEIAERTQGIVTMYQLVPEGFIAISTNKRNRDGKSALGEFIPAGSPIHTLVMRERTYYGRDYFAKNWHFVAYKKVFQDDEVIGAICVAQKQVELEKLRREIESVVVGNESVPYIIDAVAKTVLLPRPKNEIMDYSTLIDISFMRSGRIIYTHQIPNENCTEQWLAYFKFIPEMNWIIFVGSSMQDFYGGLYKMRDSMLLIIGGAILLAITLSVILGRQITKPLTVITSKIKEISEGDADLSKKLYIRSNDEVGLLAEYFNTFVGKLRDFQEVERHRLELLIRDIQMNALQAQINPHFLYNTLETIRFMIVMKNEKAVDMVKLLADLFRVSIGRGEAFVTFRHELEHVNLYLAIQKIRYSNRFSVEIDIPESILNLYTVKFIFQPIVENSVHHGFEELDSGGIISIAARLKGDMVRIEISDNGTGIPEEQLNRLQEQLQGRKKPGSVGLQNVYDRIHLHFGDKYGLELQDRKSGGVHVIIWVPVLMKKPQDDYINDTSLLIFNS